MANSFRPTQASGSAVSGSAMRSLQSLPSVDGVQLRKSGIEFGEKVTLATWELVGHKLLSLSDSASWWIADWLAYGESQFQDRYEEAIRKTSLSYQTLRNYTWVARQFPLPRRRDKLSFSHHLEVAALEQPERDYWLRKAEELHWSRNKMRTEVRRSLRERQVQPDDDGDATALCDTPRSAVDLHLPLTSEQFADCKAIASSRRQSVEEWAIEALRMAAARPAVMMAGRR